MAKTRVHELAKELGLNSKDLLEKIVGMGIEAKSHMAALSDGEVSKIKNALGGEKTSKVEKVDKKEKEEPKATEPRKPVVTIVRVERNAVDGKVEKRVIKTEEKKETNTEKKPGFFDKIKNQLVKDGSKEKKDPRDNAARDNAVRSNASQTSETKTANASADKKAPANTNVNANRTTNNANNNSNRNNSNNNNGNNRSNSNNSNNNNNNRNNNYNHNNSANNANSQNNRPAQTANSSTTKTNSNTTNSNASSNNTNNNNNNNNNRNYNNNGGNRGFYRGNNGATGNSGNSRDLSKREVKKYKKVKKEDEVIEEEIPIIIVPENMTVNEFASKIDKPTAEVIKNLMLMGIFANINQLISFDVASKVAEKYEILLEKEKAADVEEILQIEEEVNEDELEARPPVVVVMGHVDHGKTSLLDAMRQTSVIETEQGGITQHIGASVVEHQGKKITFLDTPGHEAFTAMRLRGAKVTDIAILVVAADDGVMPQTVEAIDHAKVAGIPIIVAVNKVDKPEANVERVKQELAGYGVVSEEWGGDNIFVEVSAKENIGIENLLDTILLLAEMQDLKARKTGLAKGAAIEARLDKNKGVIATLLVEQGILHAGDPIFIGETSGNVRVMINDRGKRIKTAEPGTPVEITGLNKVPKAGDTFYVTADEKQAREFAEKEAIKNRERKMLASHNVSLDSLFTQIQSGEVKKLNILIKADVQGSAEAVRQSLEKLSNEEVIVSVIRSAAGAITESDVTLAAASNAILIGFNIRPQNSVIEAADRLKVDIKLYRVIYEAIEEIEAAMKGMLSKKYEEKVLGHAEVRSIFRASAVGTIAGCMVTDGAITKGNKVRLLRDEVIVFEGDMAGLKRFKDDVKEVRKGFDCGISLASFNDIREGDVIEAYAMEEIKR